MGAHTVPCLSAPWVIPGSCPPSAGDPSPLSVAQLANSVNTLLSRGEASNNFSVALAVVVADSLGASTLCTVGQDGTPAVVRVQPAVNTTAVLEQLNARLSEQAALGNVEGLLKNLQVCALPPPLLHNTDFPAPLHDSTMSCSQVPTPRPLAIPLFALQNPICSNLTKSSVLSPPPRLLLPCVSPALPNSWLAKLETCLRTSAWTPLAPSTASASGAPACVNLGTCRLGGFYS
jgi:hypothetical protein